MCFLSVPACQYRYLLLVSGYGFTSLHPRAQNTDHCLPEGFDGVLVHWSNMRGWRDCGQTRCIWQISSPKQTQPPNLLHFVPFSSLLISSHSFHLLSVRLWFCLPSWKPKVSAGSRMLKSHLSHLAVLNGAAWKYCSGHKSGTLGGMFRSGQDRVGKHLALCSTWQVCIWHAELGSYPELISKTWILAKDN